MTTSEGIVAALTLTTFDQLVDLVSELDDGQANTTLPVPGSHSAVQSLTHCCGVTRSWSSTANLGVPVPRGRDAEFTAVMPVTEVLVLAAATRAAFPDDVARTDLAVPPAAVPPGRTPRSPATSCRRGEAARRTGCGRRAWPRRRP